MTRKEERKALEREVSADCYRIANEWQRLVPTEPPSSELIEQIVASKLRAGRHVKGLRAGPVPTQRLRADHVVRVPQEVAERGDLTPAAKLIFGVCFTMYVDTGDVFLAVETIAKRVGCDERTVQRAVKKLVEGGFLAAIPRRGKSTRHVPTDPPPEVRAAPRAPRRVRPPK